jgi:hypothetical protein
MAVPASRTDLRDYCLRRLGFPVIEINVDPDQVQDRIDEAITLWQQFHYDAVQKYYAAHMVTQTDIDNGWVPVDANVIGVTRIFTLSTSQTNSAATNQFNMFDINYQIRLNELYDFTSADYTYFELANQHIRTLEMLFIGEVPIRYNRYENKLHIDVDWKGKVGVGSYIIAEVYIVLDVSENTTTPGVCLFWNDNWLKRYTTCLIKEQWGNNLKKFMGAQLPGGITLNGQGIYDEAIAEKKELEIELRDMYEMPAMWEVG